MRGRHMPPMARRSSPSSTIPSLQLYPFSAAVPSFLFIVFFFFLLIISPSSLAAAAADHEESDGTTTTIITATITNTTWPLSLPTAVSQSVFGEIKANPFGLVIKLPLPQLPSEQLLPPDGPQEQLLKQGTSQPQAKGISSVGGWRQCSYTVTIKTSCSSPRVTRDAVSLAFGDAYRNEVYAARLDDPASGTFERCSVDTFRVAGPCAGRTCYLYLRRSGRDGWTPEYVKVFYSPSDSRAAVTFFYKVPLPAGIWYGFNLCHGGAAATPSTTFNRLDTAVGKEKDMLDDHRTTATETEMGRPHPFN